MAKKKKKMMKRKDGSRSQRGLWDNIRAKRKRGGKMRKPGSKGAPSASAFRKAQKPKKKGK